MYFNAFDHVLTFFHVLIDTELSMDLALAMSSWSDHFNNMNGPYNDIDTRCYTHILDQGLCLRANTVAGFYEANKHVRVSLPPPLSPLPMEEMFVLSIFCTK